MRPWLLMAIVGAVAAAVGCSEPATIAQDDLALGDDGRNSASKRQNGSSGGDAPEGAPSDGIELGSGTKGTDPAPEPPRGDGDEGTSSSAPSACAKDVECNQAGRICTAGACVKGCRDGAQCPTNQVCSQGQCDFATPQVECYFDYDCALGTICMANACKPGCYASLDCPTGQTCTAGMCMAATTSTPPPTGSTTCASDGQCNPGVNGSGMICSAEGICVAGCHRDNQCPGSKICVTGMCR